MVCCCLLPLPLSLPSVLRLSPFCRCFTTGSFGLHRTDSFEVTSLCNIGGEGRHPVQDEEASPASEPNLIQGTDRFMLSHFLWLDLDRKRHLERDEWALLYYDRCVLPAVDKKTAERQWRVGVEPATFAFGDRRSRQLRRDSLRDSLGSGPAPCRSHAGTPTFSFLSHFHPKRGFHMELQWLVATGGTVSDLVDRIRMRGVRGRAQG